MEVGWSQLLRIVVYLAVYHLQPIRARFGPEGCERGFLFHNNFCYRFENAKTDFDVAKGACISFRATLTSLWKPEEMEFVSGELQRLRVPAVWIGLIPTKNNKWMWMDGSFFDRSNKDTPRSSPDLCATVTADGGIHYIICDAIMPGFVCKRPVDRLYAPTTVDISSEIVFEDSNPSQTVFERLWPPILSLVSMEKSIGSYRLATIDVDQETDCAYRCYTVDDCRAFILRCQISRKCNSFSCTLLSGLTHA